MAKLLTHEKKEQIKKLIFEKADSFGYSFCARNDSGIFMDGLIDDPDIGGSLKEYMTKEKIRTYIKDSVLNAYSKKLTKKILDTVSATETVRQIYSVKSSVIQVRNGKNTGVSVLHSDDGRIFVISCGTILKWETALRKALELIARQPSMIVNNATPSICLHLAIVGVDITDTEKKHIITALDSISVKVRFCSG